MCSESALISFVRYHLFFLYKFTAQGSITLRVSEEQETADMLRVMFVVGDTGCGISPLVLSKLFQPFSQADPSTARRFGGTGLGLTICKNVSGVVRGAVLSRFVDSLRT